MKRFEQYVSQRHIRADPSIASLPAQPGSNRQRPAGEVIWIQLSELFGTLICLYNISGYLIIIVAILCLFDARESLARTAGVLLGKLARQVTNAIIFCWEHPSTGRVGIPYPQGMRTYSIIRFYVHYGQTAIGWNYLSLGK